MATSKVSSADTLADVRETHTIVVFARDGVGLGVECAQCGADVGFTDQSGCLADLNAMAEAHWARVVAGTEPEVELPPRMPQLSSAGTVDPEFQAIMDNAWATRSYWASRSNG